jgi:hypothetical protein
MPFQKEQIQQARQADLVEYLRARGYELKREGQNFRVPGHGGLIVRANHWRQFSTGEGGNALDFLVKVMGRDFKTAIQELTGVPVAVPGEMAGLRKKLKPLVMPPAARNQRRVIAYLTKTRGLPVDIVVSLIRAGLLLQDDRGNCVFPCLDETGEARGAILEGTLSNVRWKGRAPGSDISYPWWWPPAAGGKSDLVTVTESPIDAMSLAVLRPGCRACHIIALGGLHLDAVEGFISRLNIRRVVLALDNDSEGQKAAKRLSEGLLKTGVHCWILKPEKKDWNSILGMV